MDAYCTIRFRLNDVVEDLAPGETLEDIVRDLIASEGILGLTDDQGEIVAIREAR
jgi:hypothetical protein